MVEKVRAYVGATELEYSTLNYVQQDDTIVNTANMSLEANSLLSIGTVINFKKSDGSTNVFSAKITNLKKTYLWNLELKANGYELLGVYVEKIYTGKSPEAIVQDIIDNFTTTLTYVGTQNSSVTIDKYVAKGYAIDVLRDMMNILGWRLPIDENDNVDFLPQGYTDSGLTFVNGTDCNVDSWEYDETQLVNKAKLIGGFEGYEKTETITGSGTTFSLDKKPTGVFKAVVSGSSINPNLYTVNSEDKTVVFDSSQTDPTFTYEYSKPVVAIHQDDDSFNTYKEKFKEIQAPHINNLSDARKFVRTYISTYSQPLKRCVVNISDMRFDINVNNLITVDDNTLRGEFGQLAVYKIVFDMVSGTTKCFVGSKDFIFSDGISEIQKRIKDLERRSTSEDEQTYIRTIKGNLKVSLSVIKTFKYNSPIDSFVLGHQTLGRLRSDLNFESDCSDNSNHGTWSGTGIDGSQYNVAGYRLSCGVFNGTDNKISVTGTSITAQNVSFAIKTSTNNQHIMILALGVIISIDSNWNIITSGLGSVSITVDNVSGNTIVGGSWNNVSINFSSTTFDAIVIGYTNSSNYFSGSLDEVQIYNAQLTSTERGNIISKFLDSPNHTALLSKCKLWFSMDNPRLGDRSTTKTEV